MTRSTCNYPEHIVVLFGSSGAQIPPTSFASTGLNMAVFIVCAWFALFVLFLRPLNMPLMYFASLIGAFLEAGASFFIVLLTIFPTSSNAQTAMFAQEVSLYLRSHASSQSLEHLLSQL